MLKGKATAFRLLMGLLFAAGMLGCASAPPVATEPQGSAEIPGLAPPPAPAPDSVPPSTATRTTIPPRERPGAAGSTSAPAAAAHPGESCPARVGSRALRRSALSHTLDAGLGNWLRGVDVEPKIEHGHFQGWLVRAIYTGDPCWADVDLRVGDVVNRVNRRPIERPEQAQAVWSALRNAGEIVVDFWRAGQPRTLKFSVVDDGG